MSREVVYRGFGFQGVLVALVTGAVAGAAAAVLLSSSSGNESKRRLQALVDSTRDAAERLPEALRRAGLAARDAFAEAVSQSTRAVPRTRSRSVFETTADDLR